MPDATHLLVEGSGERAPAKLWSSVLEAGGQKTTWGAPTVHTLHQPTSAQAKRLDFARKLLSSAPRIDLVDPAELQRIVVCSLRVPFEGAVGVSYSGVARPETTLLYLISQAARSRHDFTVFDSMLVKAMLQYKWEAYADVIFRTQFFAASLHLCVVSLFSFIGVRFLEDTATATQDGGAFGATVSFPHQAQLVFTRLYHVCLVYVIATCVFAGYYCRHGITDG